MIEFERDAWASGFQSVAGVDEAGRGPLAGPVVAGAVIFDPFFLEKEQDGLLAELNDSKKLTHRKREYFFELLHESPSAIIGVGEASPLEIDTINILNATHVAMARAVADLKPQPEHALVDGRPVKKLGCPFKAIVKGDSKSLSIAAASIVAKVTRDRIMVGWDRKHPEYGFAKHKGYGTKIHIKALQEHGPVSIHRRSFKPVRDCL